jgi:hypothetical protein
VTAEFLRNERMTEPRTPQTDVEVPKERPVDWPLLRRLRYFGGVGLLCALGAIAVELWVGDVQGDRALNVYASPGWTALGPVLRGLAFGIPVAGLVIGGLLPLYRHRYGGALIGLLAYFALLAGLVLGARIGETRYPSGGGVGGFELFQGLALFVGFGVVAALLGMEARSMALGEPDDGSTWSWPSW